MIVAIVTIAYVILLFAFSGIAQKKQNEAVARGGKGSFLMAGKNLSMILVGVLMGGACIGGALTTGVSQLVQTAGVSAAWYGLANIIGVLFLGIVGAKRIRRLGYSTNAEMVADYCGPTSRYMMVVGQLIIILGVACLQYVTGGAMLASMFPGVISYQAGLVITAVAFAVVCLVGGLLGTSLANLINVIVIYIGLFVCGIAAVAKFGGWDAMISGMQAVAQTQSTIHGGSWMSLTGGLGLATCLSYVVSEPGNRITTQSNTMCCAAAKDEKAARGGIIIGGLLCLPVLVISVIIGLVAKVNFPEVASAQSMATVIMSLHPALAALGMAGLWAVTISTGVALLMASVQLVCFDILVPFRKKSAQTADRAAANKKQQSQSRIVLVILVAVTLFMAYKAKSIVGTIITVLCITPAFFWMMLSFLYFPQVIKKRSALITQGIAYIFFFLWLFIPAVKAAIPTPIYVEWPLCTVVWFLCALIDKEPIEKVMPKSERKLSAGIMKDDE